MSNREWPEGVDVEALTDAVSIIAARLANRHRRIKAVEESDIQQELWIFAWRKREKIREYMDREDRRSVRKGWSALLTTLERAGERYCQKVKAQTSGYEIQDVVWYSRDAMKDWIGVLVNGDGVLTNQADEEVRHTRLANEAFNLEATVADVERALQSLPVTERWLLVESCAHGTTQKKLAEILEVSDSTIQRRIEDALKQMVEFLGGERPW